MTCMPTWSSGMRSVLSPWWSLVWTLPDTFPRHIAGALPYDGIMFKSEVTSDACKTNNCKSWQIRFSYFTWPHLRLQYMSSIHVINTYLLRLRSSRAVRRIGRQAVSTKICYWQCLKPPPTWCKGVPCLGYWTSSWLWSNNVIRVLPPSPHV